MSPSARLVLLLSWNAFPCIMSHWFADHHREIRPGHSTRVTRTLVLLKREFIKSCAGHENQQQPGSAPCPWSPLVLSSKTIPV